MTRLPAAWRAGADTALVIVDMQNDFCPGGKLAVTDGDAIVPVINELRGSFSTVILTQDWHPAGHSSFTSAHPGRQPFDTIDMPYGKQVLWPDHCVQGTDGAALHPRLVLSHGDLLLRKGERAAIDSYSGFYENDRRTSPFFSDGSTLTRTLRARDVTKLIFAGLAFDYCVGWNGLDARTEGFAAFILADACRSIAPQSAAAMTERLQQAGARIVSLSSLASVLA